ncbi:MAG: aminotransferase class III-fold pyridoxal phosphate-dependent enzyme, partial [bacterium]|nr:aminotransferase class III-fold pyridoxal phosphate-dependent enzyme [bacterium]
PGSQGGTYGGNAVACAAAVATLDVIRDEGLEDNAAERGVQLLSLLDDLRQQHPDVVAEVRGLGLMAAIEFRGDDGAELARKVIDQAEARGLLLLTCGPGGTVVRWIPPLIVSAQQISEAVEIFSESLDAAVS